jgi:phage tail sheath protein FI
VLTTFLLALWQRGALAGASPAQAFFVKCDEQNNPSSTRERGELHIDVGVAPSKPFEFVVLRVGRSDNEFQTTEVAAGVSGRGGL